MSLFLILYTRLRYGYFGGKKLKNNEFTTFVRWAPGFILVVSFILFFVSGTSLILESEKISGKAEQLGNMTLQYSKNVFGQVHDTYQNLISLNMLHVTDGFYLNTDIFDIPLEESKEGMIKAAFFNKDIKLIDNRRVIITFVLFSLGFIVFILGLLGFLLKIESFAQALAIFMGLIVALDFLLIIPYTFERVASTDFCEQIIECVTENSLPVSGHEIGFYFSDFSNQSKQKFDISLTDLNNLLLVAKAQVSKYQGHPINSYKDINPENNELVSMI